MGRVRLVALIVALFTGTYAQSQSPGTLSPATRSRGRAARPGRRRQQRKAGRRRQRSRPIRYWRREPAQMPDWRLRSPRRSHRGPHPCLSRDCRDGSFACVDKAGRLRRGSSGARVHPAPLRTDVERHARDACACRAGQSATSIEVRLASAGSFSGRIFSDSGDGLTGVEVELLRRAYLPGGAPRLPSLLRRLKTEDVPFP